MQEDQYYEFFLPKLATIGMVLILVLLFIFWNCIFLWFLKGYKGVFKKRYGEKVDGCCIFYKKKKFNVLREELIDYHVPDIPLLDR